MKASIKRVFNRFNYYNRNPKGKLLDNHNIRLIEIITVKGIDYIIVKSLNTHKYYLAHMDVDIPYIDTESDTFAEIKDKIMDAHGIL